MNLLQYDMKTILYRQLHVVTLIAISEYNVSLILI